MKTVLVPVDFSSETARVCDAAAALAKRINARLVFFHVVLPPPAAMSNYWGLEPSTVADAVIAGEEFATNALRTLGQRYAKSGHAVQTAQQIGPAAPAILAKAASGKAVYIVIGSHGHGAVYDLLVGSTTSGVLRDAPCPVLVVPMRPARARR
ncbi:MAG: universal stress protein [Lacunisphaera sp.]